MNTASLRGYTPQYAGLQTLRTRYRDKGLMIVGVPSNDFGGQEPGGEAEIGHTLHRYAVSFPIAAKVPVRGAAAHPFYPLGRDRAPARYPALEFPQIPGRRLRRRRGTDRCARRCRRRARAGTGLTRPRPELTQPSGFALSSLASAVII